MGLFTKNEEKKESLLPELPKLPELPRIPQEQMQEKELPALPRASTWDNIKTNISQPQEKRSFELSEIPNKLKSTTEKGPIYIKIDKFKEASKNFDVVKNKLIEIEDSFKKLKDIKEKEDVELKDWEMELQNIKSRINNIDSALFNKLGE